MDEKDKTIQELRRENEIMRECLQGDCNPCPICRYNYMNGLCRGEGSPSRCNFTVRSDL